MALIDFSGFDIQQDNLPMGSAFFDYTDYSQTYYDSTTSTRFGVGRAIQHSSSFGSLWKYFDSVSVLTVGFAFKSFDGLKTFILDVGNNDDNEQIRWYIQVQGKISVYRGDGDVLLANTGFGIFDNTVWNYFEFKQFLSNTTGYVIARLNGAVVINETGIDTLFTGSTETINRIELFFGDNNAIDDMYLLDGTGTEHNDFLGDVRVDLLLPSANGTTNNGTASAGSNYECVNEVDFNTSDYVTLDAVDEIELYALGDLPSTSYTKTIYGVKILLRAKKTETASRGIVPILRVNGTNYEHSDGTFNLSTDYQIFKYKTWFLNPDDSNVWEEADINALEAGIKITI